MTYQFFERKEHSKLYHKYMIREPKEVQRLILSYMKEKGTSFGLAVDAGCGTGQSTRILASQFQKVVGVDISKSQIQVARGHDTPPNVSYMLAAAEKLPFEDNCVDLITASVAAHWFKIEEFMREADRVLKPGGCLALYCPNPPHHLHYKDYSQQLSCIFMKDFNFLVNEFGGERFKHLSNEYKDIFEAVPFADKKRVTKILFKQQLSIKALFGYTESLYMFQRFFQMDKEAAKRFLQSLQERILETMGATSTDTELEFSNNYVCVLACKSKS